MTATGRLIVVEGLDGSGKTTLSRHLARKLQAPWFTTPDSDLRALRPQLEAALSCPDARQLFFAASVREVASRLAPHLASGQDVVVDRYWLSTWAYGVERGTSLDLREIELGLPPADITFFLSANRALRALRMAQRGNLTDVDRRSLDPEVEVSLLARYHLGLQRPVAGHVVHLHTGQLEEHQALFQAWSALQRDPSLATCRAPRSSGVHPVLAGPLSQKKRSSG
jgi:thymidylate kinase